VQESRRVIELLAPKEMAEADRLTIEAGTPGIALMESAGLAVADAVATRHPLGTRVVVLAGPGNNGGDGFVAARILRERGYPVQAALLGDRARLAGDAALAANRWKGPVAAATPDIVAGADVVVDALFGAGLARPIEGEAARLVEAVNASPAAVVAVDLPSGVSGETGAVLGTAIRAGTTVTFFRRKPGHLLMPGRAHAGRIRVADIGIRERVLAAIRPKTFANEPPLWLPAWSPPAAEGHKYARGHAVVVSGGAAATGAARLAAAAALRAGAGLVSVASPPDAVAVNAAQLTAVMVKPFDGAGAFAALLSDPRFTAVAVGPGNGVGEGTRALTFAALAGDRGVVLDADAVTSHRDAPAALFAAVAAMPGGRVVLTPHEGEFARLFPDLAAGAGHALAKTDRARQAARRSGAVVVLKGADTVIAAPDGRAAINCNAPPWLATAGSGDCLTGIVTGLLALGMPAFEAAAMSAWMHGEAAADIGPGLIAEDIAPALKPLIARLVAMAAG
jgi:hydroxyethylthiazole kinase-like uncharacterized protein yjeF